MAAVFLPVALNVVVWWRLRHAIVGDTSAPWRRLVAYLGLATNSLAYAIPWGSIIYNYILLNRSRDVNANEFIDGLLVVKVSVALAALSLVLGALGPKHVQAQLILSALIVGCFWFSIPIGVL
jgi:hypothetical protein